MAQGFGLAALALAASSCGGTPGSQVTAASSACGSASCATSFTTGTTSSTTCIPVNQTIRFYGSGISLGTTTGLVGGTFPGYPAHGSIVVGNGTVVSGATYSGRSSIYASVEL